LKTISFRFQTEHTFSLPVSGHRFLLKILPRSDSRQYIKNMSWSVEPKSVLWRTKDGFGNMALAGCADDTHDRFVFGVKGVAEVEDVPHIKHKSAEVVFTHPSEMTRPSAALSDFYEGLVLSAPADKIERMQYFAHAVNTFMRYETGSTTYKTTASQAFSQTTGVCQDFAHILLVLLRMAGIPCRYVAGFASDYGETHAWVEAWANGRYYGVDPTRDKLIDEYYIAISRGRDSKDCSIERGIYKGVCASSHTIYLDMEVQQ